MFLSPATFDNRSGRDPLKVVLKVVLTPGTCAATGESAVLWPQVLPYVRHALPLEIEEHPCVTFRSVAIS